MGGPFQFLQFAQGRSELTAFICDDRKTPEGLLYGLWQGEFELKGSHRWNTAIYPFDWQVLHIEFETPLGADALQFVAKRQEAEDVDTDTGFWSAASKCWQQKEFVLKFFINFSSCQHSLDPYRDLNIFLKGWKVTDVSARTYNFDYNSCFGFECTVEAEETKEDCSNALADTLLSRDEKAGACVDLYSRFSLAIEIDRDQTVILPLLLFFGPIFPSTGQETCITNACNEIKLGLALQPYL